MKGFDTTHILFSYSSYEQYSLIHCPFFKIGLSLGQSSHKQFLREYPII